MTLQRYVCFAYDCDCGCGERILVARFAVHAKVEPPSNSTMFKATCSRGNTRKFNVFEVLCLPHWEESADAAATGAS